MISHWGYLLFTCALCERDIYDWADRKGKYRQIDPICNYCVSVWGKEPSHGAFMDRRIAARLLAAADKLATEAYRKQNPIYWSDNAPA